MITITQNNVQQLLTGTAFLGTGGGLPMALQQSIFEELLTKHAGLCVVDLEELPEDAMICTAYGVGSTAQIPEDFGPTLRKGIALLQEKLGAPIAGIFPGESNIEALTFQAAHAANLPVINADGTGGRAVPLLSIDNFYLQNTSPLPALLMSLDGACVWVEAMETPAMLEATVRTLQQASEQRTMVVFDHLCTVHTARRLLTTGTISTALALGTHLMAQETEAPLPDGRAPRQLLKGTITHLHCQTNTHTGLYEGTVKLHTIHGTTIIHVRNEYLAVEGPSGPLVTAPDLITLIDKTSNMPLHSSTLALGQEVLLYTLCATPQWRSQAGQDCFTLTQFSIPLPTTLPPL